MNKICKNCEHRILSECPGADEGLSVESCFLDNQYGLASDSAELRLMSSSYSGRHNWVTITREQAEEALVADIIGLDVHLDGVKSPLFGVWNVRRAICALHQLEMYQMLNVKLTLADYCGESFYAGMPKLTAKFMRKVKQWLKK